MAIVNLYQVTWHNNRHNGANTSAHQDFVVAAAGAQGKDLASTIQTNNSDNQTVTVDGVIVVRTGIIQ